VITTGQAVVVAILLTLLWGGAMLMVAPDRMVSGFEREVEQAQQWFGEKRAQSLYARAAKAIAPAFGHQEVMSLEAMAKVEPKLVGASIHDFQPIIVQALFRAMIVGLVLLVMAPLIIAAVVDGVVIRLKKNEELHSENPRIYHFAKHILIVVFLAPGIIAMVPIGIGPPLAVAWGALVTFAVWGMAQNVEREV
jgi:hypothetical protein